MHQLLLKGWRVGYLSVILLSLVVYPGLAQEQAADTTFLRRNMRQQMFVINHLKEHDPVGLPVTIEEVDTFFREIESAWMETVEGEDPLMGQFNPYVAIWMMHSVYAKAGEEISKETECHTYNRYVIPAFLSDFERYRDVKAAHAPLIRWGYDWAGGTLTFGCEINRQTWDVLVTAFNELPAILQRYLNDEAYPDANIAGQIQGAYRFFSNNAPLYAIRDALYREALDEAFAGLAAATTQEYGAYYLTPLGNTLWKAYLNSDKTAHALATLDLLTRTLTAGDLARDTLQAWYKVVDPERGPERFSLMTASQLPTLVASEKKVRLTGTYTDLQTGKSKDLEEINGQLVLLDFWATWCAPCIGEIPQLQEIVAQYGDRITFISINADAITDAEDAEGVRAFMGKHGIDYAVLYDQKDRSLAAQFGVRGYPAKFLIDSDGRLLAHPSNGRHFLELAEVEAHLESFK